MEDIHRQTMLESRAALLRTSESLQRARKTAVETEEVATTVVHNLDSQHEALIHARDRLVDTDYELTRTQQLLRLAQRTVFANKLLLIFIIFAEIMILGCSIYLKYLRK